MNTPQADSALSATDLGAVLDRHQADPHALVQILREVQAQHGWLPRPVLGLIAERLGLTLAQVEGVAGFYRFFHLPVWLSVDFSGETLWAYNLEHLNFLAEHVGAKLRERNSLAFNVRSIGARLPRWMTAADNREAILKAIEKLKEK